MVAKCLQHPGVDQVGVRNSLQVSQVGGRVSNTYTIIHCLSGALTGSWDGSRGDTCIQDASSLSSSLLLCTKMTTPKLFSFKGQQILASNSFHLFPLLLCYRLLVIFYHLFALVSFQSHRLDIN